MMTTTLIHVAIWTHFAVSHAAGMHFDLHAAKAAPAPAAEQVVLRESTLSEKCNFDLEPIARPDPEIAALQADASRFKSSIDLRANAKGPSWETPTTHHKQYYKTNWNEQFDLRWDDDDVGFTLGGKHFPKQEVNPFLGPGGLELSQTIDR